MVQALYCGLYRDVVSLLGGHISHHIISLWSRPSNHMALSPLPPPLSCLQRWVLQEWRDLLVPEYQLLLPNWMDRKHL